MAWISDFVYKWNPIMKIRGVTLPSIETQHQQLETPSCCFQIQTLLSRERWKQTKTCFAKKRDSVGSPPLVLVTMQKFRKWIKSPNDAWLRAMTPITNLSDEQEIQTALPHNYCLDDPHQYSVVASIIFWHLVAMTNAPTGFLWREWTHCVFNKHKPQNEYPKIIPKITTVSIYPKIWQNTMWLFLKDEEMFDYRVSQNCVT